MARTDNASAPPRAIFTEQLSLQGRDGVFFAAVRQAGLPMVVTDPRRTDNPVVFANAAFLQQTGYELDEVVGRNCRFMQGVDTDPEAVAVIGEAIHERRSATVELLNYRRDGSSFWNALFISPVFGADGELLYFFGSQLDLTRQRAAEAALHQARKLEAVGQLTSGVAHDFNNLLMVVAGNLELMDRSDAPERRRQLSSRMREAIARARRLTDQLLAFARRQQLNGRVVDLNLLVAGLSDSARRILGPNIRLETRLAGNLVPCLVDAAQTEVALANLLLNARDAMPNGGVVTVSTSQVCLGPGAPEVVARELPAGDYASLVVADAGVGMPAEILDRATEPFFSTKNGGTGAGLGLSTVHGFARQSRGHLLLKSKPGRGTSVRLLFPLARDSA